MQTLDMIAYEHVGIRVSDITQALKFYRLLGFEIDPDEYYPQHQTTGLTNRHGLHINLVSNADCAQADSYNVLIDAAFRSPGLTHLAMVVEDLEATVALLNLHKIRITEGPLRFTRRIAIFIRDPDGNVIEINQLLQPNSLNVTRLPG